MSTRHYERPLRRGRALVRRLLVPRGRGRRRRELRAALALSQFPVASAVPGMLGYFQVDAAGRLTTPLLPEAGVSAASYGITPAEEAARAARVAELRELLARNQLVRGLREDAPAASLAPVESGDSRLRRSRESAPAASAAQAGFDRLAGAGPHRPARRRRATLRQKPQTRSARSRRRRRPPLMWQHRRPVARATRDFRRGRAAEARRGSACRRAGPYIRCRRRRRGRCRRSQSRSHGAHVRQRGRSVRAGRPRHGASVLFRNVWRDGQRYVQGALVDRPAFVATALEAPYRASSVGGVARLTVAFQGRRSIRWRRGSANIDRRPAT